MDSQDFVLRMTERIYSNEGVMTETGLLFFINVIVPILVAPIYFVMAKYIKKVTPLRQLIVGEKTYQYAFWIFMLFGLFLIGRPIQILCGAHPFPLIVSSIREFIMIGLLTPCIIVGAINHVFYETRIPRIIPILSFGICIALGLAFIVINIYAIGGAAKIFEYRFLGIDFVAYDGRWFFDDNPNIGLVSYLFLIRLISPVLLMFATSAICLWRAFRFPKNSIYANLPKKYFLEGMALFLFGSSMVFTGIMAVLWGIQSQWYYLGALLAGIIAFIGLRMPPRNFVVKNDL